MADAFWKTHLLGKPPLLLLPTDRPRTSTASPLFKVPLTLAAEEVSKLAAIGEAATGDLNATRGNALSWTVLAAFQVLLSRYSRQDDITVGTSPLIGGAELMPLRVDLDGKPTFEGLVAQNARLALDILDHAGVSIKQLAEAAGADKFDFSLGTHPVFQVAFLLDGGEEATRLAHGWNLDVLLELREIDGTLQGHLCGKETFFAQATIERAAKHFKTLVGSIITLADKSIVELDFVDDEERELVMHTFNNTARVLPAPYAGATIHGLFEHWASVTPNAKAISFEGKHYTYRELDERANQVARFLEANGVVEGQPVGVMLERSLELMVAMMGVLKSGGAFVPMDPEYPEDRLALMAEDAEVPVLLSLERIDVAIPLPPNAKRVNLDADWDQIARYSAKPPKQSRSHPNGLAYIIFTSGSTGRPKGTLLQHSGLINYLYYLISEHDLGAKDVFLQKTPISFDVSVRELFFPFSVGAELVFAVPGGHRDTAYLAEVIAKRGITCCSFVPSQLEVFLQEVDGSACKALRRVFVSGEALPPTSVAKFLEHLPHAQLHNLYGPTEATVDVTGYDVRLHKGRATVPIGYPIANVKMYVLDPQLRPLPVGVPGELMISSLQLARGYIKRPDLTAEKFIDCPFGEGDYGKMYRTGDLARWLPEGVIEFLGRLDHQVKLRGFRIELGEIENGLCNVPGIRQAVVVVVKDHAGTNHLVGYVTPEDVDIAVAAKELGQHVPEYMVPEVIMPLPELPTLPNGKVNRRGLPEPDFSGAAQMDYSAPRNVIEEEIQDSWHEVFKIQPISVDADFFKIGGNSLLAGKVVSRLRQGFGVELPFTSIFQQRTIEDMALFIQSKLQQQPASSPGEEKTAEDVSIPLMYGEKERVASTPCSYSQELLLFNNELDPFNPVHNEAAWVRLHGELDVLALVKALRYLVERHTVLSSHFSLAGVAGPMLRQTRPSKFKLPLTYKDLLSGEELPLPTVSNGRTIFKKAVLSAKKANRKERLQKLQSTNLDIVASAAMAAVQDPAAKDDLAEKKDAAHIPVPSLPSIVTQNLAQQIDNMRASIPQEYGDLKDLRSWLMHGSSPSPTASGALPPDETAGLNGTTNETSPVLDHNIPTIAERQSDSSSQALSNGGLSQPLPSQQSTLRPPLSAFGASNTETLGGQESGVSVGSVESVAPKPPSTVFFEEAESTPAAPAPVRATRDLGGDAAKTPTSETNGKPPKSAGRKSSGCFPKRNDQVKTPKPVKPAAMEIEQKSDQIREVEAIASRVKRSLLLHYLTCGIYSVRQSGGTQGFWKGMRENFATLAGYPDAPVKALEELPPEGGIMIPELANRHSMPSQTLQELLLKDSSQHFKIMQGPLIRITLIKVNEDEHVLLLTMHHAVTDGWSYGIIWRELGLAYSAFNEGRSEVELESLPIQYADFATWQRRWLAQGTMAAQIKFWRETMTGASPLWDFPTDFPRPAVPSGQSARVHLSFKPAVVEALKGLSGQVNATMFMALLAAYNVLLAHYSFDEDLVCGLPHAGRTRAETEGLIGAFMGAVALRTDLSGNPSFRQVMQRVRKGALEIFENADTPIHLIMVEVLGLNNLGGCAAPPLFQTMFFLHEASWLEGLEMSGLRAELPAKVEKNVARFDLTLEMTYDAERNDVTGHIEYRTDLFKRSTVEAMTRHFEVLLEGIVEQPDGSIWDLPLLTAEDTQQIDSIRGVPSQLLPSGAAAKTARPRILSPRGTPVPPGVPGRLHISFTADPKPYATLTSRGSMFGRHGSIMNMISGAGAKFSQMFEEEGPSSGGPPSSNRRAKAQGGKATSRVTAADLVPEWRNKHAGKKGMTHSPSQEALPASAEAAGPTDVQPTSPFGGSTESPRWVDAEADAAVSSGSRVATPTGRSADASGGKFISSPDASAEMPKPVEQTINTGFTARITREGKLEVIGKASNKVTMGGMRVQLEDIDRAILSASYEVAQAATVLMTDPEGEPRLVAYIAPANIDLFQLDVALRQKVPPNLVPTLFQPLRRLPTNTHGEVDRSALPAANWTLKVPRVYAPPQSRLEMEVQLIWQAVINKGVISCDADFSEIGGNMMHAVIANGIVREALGVQMPAINIFRDRTIRNVAERIRQLRRRARVKSVS